jgi:hypothetical protein
MDFNELITDFADRHNVDGLAAEDGVAALDVDGILVNLVAAGDLLAASAEIGEPPAEGAGTFAELLLEASLESEAFFAKSRETGKYVVVRRHPLPPLDSASFDTLLEGLVNLAETWRRLLDDFRPAAQAAAQGTADTPAFGAGGFMQV